MKTLSEIVLPTDQQPIAHKLYKLCFSARNYSFANKVDILHEEKNPVDLKLQHKISRNNPFSRYLENAKSRNVLMQRHLCGVT